MLDFMRAAKARPGVYPQFHPREKQAVAGVHAGEMTRSTTFCRMVEQELLMLAATRQARKLQETWICPQGSAIAARHRLNTWRPDHADKHE
jgi:hypothetical protein